MGDVRVFPRGGAPNQVLLHALEMVKRGEVEDVVLAVRTFEDGEVLTAYSEQEVASRLELATVLHAEAVDDVVGRYDEGDEGDDEGA